MAGERSALEGVHVLDLTHHIAGPFCTRLLADFGADVIKVERPPDGDLARRAGPFPGAVPHPEKSGLFLYLNTNKRGIVVDLKRPAGKRLFLDLLGRADILVESFRPGVMAGLGLDDATLRKTKRDLVTVSISNFGQTGPYRDFKANELIGYAMGGQMHSTGVPDRPPVKLGGNIGLYLTGEAAATAACMALFGKEMRGEGDSIDISIFETQASNQDRRSIFMLNYEYTGALVQRHDDADGLAFGIFPCADGHLCFWSGNNRFPEAARMVGRPELIDDPLFADYRTEVSPEAVELFNGTMLLPWLMERDMHEAWAVSQEFGLTTAPIMTPGQFFDDPYFRERGFWADVEHPVAGRLDQPGRPFAMSETPYRVRRPAPLLGEHTEEVLQGELGYGREEIERLDAGGSITRAVRSR